MNLAATGGTTAVPRDGGDSRYDGAGTTGESMVVI